MTTSYINVHQVLMKNFHIFQVVHLEYESFVPMAEKEIKKICQAIRAKWEVEHVAFFHRCVVYAL